MLVSLKKLSADGNLLQRFRWIAFIKAGVALREPNIASVPVTMPPHTHTYSHTQINNNQSHIYKHTRTVFIDPQLSSCQQVVQLTGYSEELLSVVPSTHMLHDCF